MLFAGDNHFYFNDILKFVRFTCDLSYYYLFCHCDIPYLSLCLQLRGILTKGVVCRLQEHQIYQALFLFEDAVAGKPISHACK